MADTFEQNQDEGNEEEMSEFSMEEDTLRPSDQSEQADIEEYDGDIEMEEEELQISEHNQQNREEENSTLKEREESMIQKIMEKEKTCFLALTTLNLQIAKKDRDNYQELKASAVFIKYNSILVNHVHVILCQLHKLAFQDYKCKYAFCEKLRGNLPHIFNCLKGNPCNNIYCMRYCLLINHWRECADIDNCIFCHKHWIIKEPDTFNRFITSMITRSIHLLNGNTYQAVELLKFCLKKAHLLPSMDCEYLLPVQHATQVPLIPVEIQLDLLRCFQPLIYANVPADFTISSNGNANSNLFQEVTVVMRCHLTHQILESFLRYDVGDNMTSRIMSDMLGYSQLIELQAMESNSTRDDYYESIYDEMKKRTGRCSDPFWKCYCYAAMKRQPMADDDHIEKFKKCSNYPTVDLPLLPSQRQWAEINITLDDINRLRKSMLHVLVQANIRSYSTSLYHDIELRANVYYAQILEKKTYEAMNTIEDYERMTLFLACGIRQYLEDYESGRTYFIPSYPIMYNITGFESNFIVPNILPFINPIF